MKNFENVAAVKGMPYPFWKRLDLFKLKVKKYFKFNDEMVVALNLPLSDSGFYFF